MDWNLWYLNIGLISQCHSPCGSVDWNIKSGFNLVLLRSLPVRECGLKFRLPCKNPPRAYCHSPCGSVDWNWNPRFTRRREGCHSPCGSVDWNNAKWYYFKWIYCHSPCGSVDWNNITFWTNKPRTCHSPCGSVDWNEINLVGCEWSIVTPRAGVWIEITFIYDAKMGSQLSLPVRECGLKSPHCLLYGGESMSLPVRECGLKSACSNWW